jgi:hypothetical protein
MKKILSRRPSPAIMIAIVALIVALGGTAVAGGGLLTNKKFNKAAVKGPIQYVSASTTIPNNPPDPVPELTATCPAGTHVIGGGAHVSRTDGGGFIDDSYPSGGNAWKAKFDNNSTGPTYTATVTAICATVRATVGG